MFQTILKNSKLYISYDWGIIKQAGIESIELVYPNRKGIVPLILVWVIATGLLYATVGQDSATEEIRWAASVFGGLVIIGIVVFFCKLATVPFKQNETNKHEIKILNKKLASKIKSLEVADYLQNAYGMGGELVAFQQELFGQSNMIKPIDPAWIDATLKWYHQTLILLQENTPQEEAFMFESIIPTPPQEPTMDNAWNMLNARRNKLRKIISRYLKEIENAPMMEEG